MKILHSHAYWGLKPFSRFLVLVKILLRQHGCKQRICHGMAWWKQRNLELISHCVCGWRSYWESYLGLGRDLWRGINYTLHASDGNALTQSDTQWPTVTIVLTMTTLGFESSAKRNSHLFTLCFWELNLCANYSFTGARSIIHLEFPGVGAAFGYGGNWTGWQK